MSHYRTYHDAKGRISKRILVKKPPASAEEHIPAIATKFIVQDADTKWLVECPHCKSRWALAKPTEGKTLHPGNVLHLLNHYAGHKVSY